MDPMTATLERIRQHQNHIVVRRRLEEAKSLPDRMADAETVSASIVRRMAELEDIVSAQRNHIKHLMTSATAAGSKIKALEMKLADAQKNIGVSQTSYRSVADIVAGVLTDFPGVTWEEIIGSRQTKKLMGPRHACIRAVYDERKDMSFKEIGKIFRRDRTAIHHVITKEQA